ncbi:hypothetical protein L7F22_021355 [Adiantum nelumboides]|nr:hypothetical protein [Adiantum nelumboides]
MSAVLALPQVKNFLKILAKGKEQGQEQGKEHDVNAHAVAEKGEPSKKPWDEDIPELSSPSYSPHTSFSYSSDSSSSSNPRRRIHALPLQAVTMDNDSEGSTFPGPSSSVEYAGIFQPDQGAQQSLLYSVRVWYTNAKRAQNVPESIQQGLEWSKTGLQTVVKSQILQQIKSSKLATFGFHWWESSQPWVKWPVSIFIPWFLLVSLSYGISASKDLLPLWVIGPLLTGLALKASIQLFESYRQWLVDSNLTQSITFVTEGVKTGELPRQVVEALASRFEEVRINGVKKKEELEIFFRSGEYKRSLRKHADKKLFEVQEAFIDKYEDWRLVYLYLERKMKNII